MTANGGIGSRCAGGCGVQIMRNSRKTLLDIEGKAGCITTAGLEVTYTSAENDELAASITV